MSLDATAARRWSGMPAWVLLLACLAMTASLAWARSSAVAVSREGASESAEGHFRDVVTDIERRLSSDTTRRDGLSSATLRFLATAPTTESAGSYLDDVDLVGKVPDVVAVVVYSAAEAGDLGAGVVEYVSAGSGVDARMAAAAWAADELALATASATRSGEASLVHDLVVSSASGAVSIVVYSPAESATAGTGKRWLTFWYPAEGYMASSISAGHHVGASLTPAAGGTSIRGASGIGHSGDTNGSAGNVDPGAAAGMVMPGGPGVEPSSSPEDGTPRSLHDHGDLVHLHDVEGGFVARRSVELGATSFELLVASAPGFVTVPSSREVQIVIVAGLAMSVALFLLVSRLVRSRDRYAEAVASLGESNSRFLAGFDNAPIGMAELNLDGVVTRANESFCKQLSRPLSEVLGHVLADGVHADDRDLHHQTLMTLADGSRSSAQLEIRYRGPDGTPVWVVESISVVPDRTDRPIQFLVQSQDVTANRNAQKLLARRALHDELTGLPNRALLMDRLHHALRHCDRADSRLAVLFIDLDRFKIVNDSLGHGTGDQLLISVGHRLAEAVRSDDTIARFGGDEFVVLCDLTDPAQDADIVIDRVASALAEPIVIGDVELVVTASIGIAVGGGRGATDTPEALVRDADAAMYRAKEGGRNRSAFFDENMRTAALDRLDLEQALRGALERDELELHYQPLIGVAANTIEGVEALIRWRHPQRGLLMPDAFINIATEIGLMDAIDRYALQSGCEQLAEWSRRQPGSPSLLVAINTSPATFLNRGFVEFVEHTINSTGVDATRLWIEVTEGALLDNTEVAIATMEQLQRLGVRIAIDDFGTGYSSLSYLTKFPFDILKLDRSFLDSNRRDHPHAAILAAVAEMARAVGTPIVIEGVETAKQLALVESVKATYIQGYFFDRPQPASVIESKYLGAAPTPSQKRELARSR